MLGDILNKAGNALNYTLYNIDKSIHSQIEDTFLDDFIHDLRSYLFKSDSIYQLSKLPEDTILDINEIESEYIQCYLNHVEYAVPKDMVYSEDLKNLVNNGHIKLQLQDDNLYHVIDTKKES